MTVAQPHEALPHQALIGRGQVRHERLRPRPHRFAYASYFLLLPMRQLRASPCAALRRNRLGWLSFHDADHGDGRADSLAWLDELLAREGIHDAQGEVWLHCFPRVLGHAFKPVSFWYCHRSREAGAGLAAIVVEVNNTFGERHCYLLEGADLAYGQELQTRKVFHVSPFCDVTGRYRFRFLHTHRPGEAARTVARIELDDGEGLLLRTSVSGALAPFSAAHARATFWAIPFMSLMVVARIHWQALRLWLKRTPFFRQPPPPSDFVTR